MRATKLVSASLALCAVLMGADRASAGAVTVSVPVPKVNVSRVTVPPPKVNVPRATANVSKLNPSTAIANVSNKGLRYYRATPIVSKKGRKTESLERVSYRHGQTSPNSGSRNVSFQEGQGGSSDSSSADSGGASGRARYYVPASYSRNTTACGRYPYPRCGK